jgi:hypothetical protein
MNLRGMEWEARLNMNTQEIFLVYTNGYRPRGHYLHLGCHGITYFADVITVFEWCAAAYQGNFFKLKNIGVNSFQSLLIFQSSKY